MGAPRITIDADRCQSCGQCIAVCTRGNIQLGSTAAEIKDPERCILCGHCKSVCPADAPRLHALNAGEFEPVPEGHRIPAPGDLLAFFRSRRSIRFYKQAPVPTDHLEQMIEAGRFAPTGGNRQPVRYLIVRTPDMITRIRKMTHTYLAAEADRLLQQADTYERKGAPLPSKLAVRLGYTPLWRAMGKLYGKGKDLLFHHAPAVAVLHANPELTSPFCADVGLAAMQMVLMAQSLGLGTCFCGFLTVALNHDPELKATLRIPVENSVVLSFVVGYPDVAYLRMVSRQPAQTTFL